MVAYIVNNVIIFFYSVRHLSSSRSPKSHQAWGTQLINNFLLVVTEKRGSYSWKQRHLLGFLHTDCVANSPSLTLSPCENGLRDTSMELSEQLSLWSGLGDGEDAESDWSPSAVAIWECPSVWLGKRVVDCACWRSLNGFSLVEL